jgi:hypothetical protein
MKKARMEKGRERRRRRVSSQERRKRFMRVSVGEGRERAADRIGNGGLTEGRWVVRVRREEEKPS